MPGIAGAFSPDPRARARVASMAATLGPDHGASRGQLDQPGLRLHLAWSHHRGSFADCAPIWNEAGTLCLIVTGETFASAEQLQALRRLGHRFGDADASHLVHLVEEQGLAALAQFNGWFSGVLVDLPARRAVLFNDRYGLSRLHVHETLDSLYFASEAKALLRVFPALRRIEASSLAQVHAFGCVLDNRTLYPGLDLLPPGSAWQLSPDGSVRRQAWFDRRTWEDQPTLAPPQFEEQLREVLARRLPAYLRGPQPLAMSLTGGLDGRLLMAWAPQPPGTLPCYSFGGPVRDCVDVVLARRVAQACGQPHRTLRVGRDFLRGFGELAARAVYLSDGEMDVSGAVELHVNGLAREIAPVRLTGNYGSEILRGHVAFRPRALDASLFEPDFARELPAATQAWQAARAQHDLSFIAFAQVPWHHHARLSLEQSQLTVRSPFLDNDLVGLMYRAPPGWRQGAGLSLKLIGQAAPGLARIPTDRGLVGGEPSPADRLRESLQTLALKAEYAWDVGMPPWLARVEGVLAPLHPERLFLGRHKFYHFRLWYREHFGPLLREVLLSPAALGRSVMRPAVLRGMVEAHLAGRANHTLALHRALSTEFIHRELLGPQGAVP